MQPQHFLGFNLELLKKNWLPLFFGICGVMLFGYGLIQFFSSSQPQNEIVFESQEESLATPSGTLVVDVGGAVEKPGVYKLPIDSRVQDAIITAGGLGQNADREWVSARINLALKLKDGLKIYIPAIGESGSQNTKSPVLGDTQDISQTNQININEASQSQLDSLPGIGSVTSSKIISNRPYSTIEELVEKKVLKQSVFEKIKEKITVF